jgi:hypothetical protein
MVSIGRIVILGWISLMSIVTSKGAGAARATRVS